MNGTCPLQWNGTKVSEIEAKEAQKSTKLRKLGWKLACAFYHGLMTKIALNRNLRSRIRTQMANLMLPGDELGV